MTSIPEFDHAYMAKHGMTIEQLALMDKLLFSIPNSQWPPSLLAYVAKKTDEAKGISGTLIEQSVREWIKMTWDG